MTDVLSELVRLNMIHSFITCNGHIHEIFTIIFMLMVSLRIGLRRRDLSRPQLTEKNREKGGLISLIKHIDDFSCERLRGRCSYYSNRAYVIKRSFV